MKEDIRKILLLSGASAIGFAEAGEISLDVHKEFVNWLTEGRHGEMAYLERHISLRKHTDNVLSGAQTVISLAFSYAPKKWRKNNLPAIAAYAYGDDYHIVLREKLFPIVNELQKKYGGKWRICIDSAPLAERYWALKSGIGKSGLNGSVIVKDCGGLCFLVEVLTTIPIIPDISSFQHCEKCGLCITSCPGKAIKGDGTIDARRCINYLTIEKKGDFTEEERKLVCGGAGHLYGCDICLRICPHNPKEVSGHTTHFTPTKDTLSITPEIISDMDQADFKKIFSRSPMSYAGYYRLLRNANTLISHLKILNQGNNNCDPLL